MKGDHKVPRISHLFFKWYCKKEMYEELHGDLEEFFYERLQEKGYFKARLHYSWDVIRCCQPYALKKPKTHNPTITMLTNYFKTSSRSLLKNPMTSLINIVGLAVAIGICLTVYAFMDFEYKIDQFHEKKHSVYLTTFFANRDGTTNEYGMSPLPIGDMIREDFSSVSKVCRIEDQNVVVKYEDEVFHETLRYVDPEFLEMFTFPLLKGTAGSLYDLNSVVISNEMALKYFGNDDPIGKDVQIIFGKEQSKTFKVAGVAEPFPKPHEITFDFLVHFENLMKMNNEREIQDWSDFITATFIQVNDPSDLTSLKEGMDKYKELHNEKFSDWTIESFSVEQLATLYKNSGEIRNALVYNSSAAGRMALPIIAIFMIGLACFNYINISIVSSAKRLKEIGIRKVIGANRMKVMVQFLAENIFVTMFALLLGMLLAFFVFLPWFIKIADRSMELDFFNLDLWIFLFAILIVTGIASGFYPALYISRFNAIKIFRGSVQFGKKNALTKVFLSVQLIIATILMTGAVMLTQNSNFQAERSWGYNPHDVIYLELPDSTAYRRLEASLLQNPDVISLSGSEHHLGSSHKSTVIRQPERQYEVDHLSVSPDYFKTMNLQLKSGRFFRKDSEGDKRALVVNQLFVENMQLDEPIGTVFELNDERYEIVGVAENFHLYNFYHELLPTIFTVADPDKYQFITIQSNQYLLPQLYANIRNDWVNLFPEIPFQGGFQTQLWSAFYKDLQTQITFSTTIAIIAVLLASLGLYGLITLNVTGRVREFSIRKVLGAGVHNLMHNITREYILLMTLSLFIAMPVSYLLNKELVGMMYPETMQTDYVGVIISCFIIVIVLAGVVSTQLSKVIRTNPVEGLKME